MIKLQIWFREGAELFYLRMALLTVLVILMSGCGEDYYRDGLRGGVKSQYIDPAFDQYLKIWERYFGRKVNISIYFSAESNNAGVCRVWDDGHREIQINPNEWGRYYNDRFYRENILFHEMGHCLLGLRHENEMFQYAGSREPASIMYSKVNHFYGTTRKVLLERLFGKNIIKDRFYQAELRFLLTKSQFLPANYPRLSE